MNKVVFLTGAGVSAESGISTFRDSNGLWEKHKIEDVCTFGTWQQNKELVFKFYNERRKQLKDVEPNLIHTKIADLQKEYGKDRVIVLTQNVDDLFERAGCEEIIHLHGFLPEMMCLNCNNTWNIGYTETNPNTPCPKCKSNNTKPNIVFFGEAAPEYSKLQKTINSLTEDDLFIVMGTMGKVIPVSEFAMNSPSINILNNLEPSFFIVSSFFDYVFYEKGTKAIVSIEEIIKEELF